MGSSALKKFAKGYTEETSLIVEHDSTSPSSLFTSSYTKSSKKKDDIKDEIDVIKKLLEDSEFGEMVKDLLKQFEFFAHSKGSQDIQVKDIVILNKECTLARVSAEVTDEHDEKAYHLILENGQKLHHKYFANELIKYNYDESYIDKVVDMVKKGILVQTCVMEKYDALQEKIEELKETLKTKEAKEERNLKSINRQHELLVNDLTRKKELAEQTETALQKDYNTLSEQYETVQGNLTQERARMVQIERKYEEIKKEKTITEIWANKECTKAQNAKFLFLDYLQTEYSYLKDKQIHLPKFVKSLQMKLQQIQLTPMEHNTYWSRPDANEFLHGILKVCSSEGLSTIFMSDDGGEIDLHSYLR